MISVGVRGGRCKSQAGVERVGFLLNIYYICIFHKSTFYRGYNIMSKLFKLLLPFVNFYLKNLHTMYVSLCT